MQPQATRPSLLFALICLLLTFTANACAAAQQTVNNGMSPSQKNDYDKFFDIAQDVEDLPPDEMYLQYDYPGSYDADSIDRMNQEQPLSIEAVSTIEIDNDGGGSMLVTEEPGSE